MPTTEDLISSNLSTLEEFDNPSVASLFQKIAQSVGVNIDLTLKEFSNSEARILAIINDQRYGKAGYYRDAALAFQLGDDLVEDPITHDNVYAVIDVSKQIIAQAAFEDIDAGGTSSQLFIKVAKLDSLQGILVQLSQEEIDAFTNYFENFELPGLPVAVVALPANILAFQATATFLKTYNRDTLKAKVSQALKDFRDTFLFNGEFFNGDLSDFIKANVPGMRDFFITATTIDGAVFNGAIPLPAGYFNYVAGIEAAITYNPF